MSSSLFPFLRSLLVSPHKADVHTATIKQTIEDRDRGGFTTPDRHQDHLSFHDTGLRGAQGALIVLEALATNPFAYKLTLSHNQLGDLGVRQLSSRLRFLHKRRTVPIHELNLASNSLTNLALADICRSWDGLTELYLSNNQIDLRTDPSSLFTLRNLTLLSLTSNPIDCRSLSDLFRHPNFAPLELNTLHLSACNLDLPVAVSLALWLEDQRRSRKLEWLAVNGNSWGIPGCERITWALARKGGNCNLLRLEMLACAGSSSLISWPGMEEPIADPVPTHPDHPDYHRQVDTMGFRDSEDLENCRKAIQVHATWEQLLKECVLRNEALKLATQRAALGLVSSARRILISSPAKTVSKDGQEICPPGTFPWNRLPEDIKLNIWRWVSILSAFPGLRVAEATCKERVEGDREEDAKYGQFPEPLSGQQLARAMEYAEDRGTLEREIAQKDEQIFHHHLDSQARQGLQKPPSFHRQLVLNLRLDRQINRLGRDSLLAACNAQCFLGPI